MDTLHNQQQQNLAQNWMKCFVNLNELLKVVFLWWEMDGCSYFGGAKRLRNHNYHQCFATTNGKYFESQSRHPFLCTALQDMVRRGEIIDDDMEDEFYLRRLDAGLFVLQLICYIMAEICNANVPQVKLYPRLADHLCFHPWYKQGNKSLQILPLNPLFL